MRLEKADEGSDKIIDQVMNVSPQISEGNYQSLQVPENGTYRIALYFGTTAANTRIWIDDVELMALKK